MIRRELIGALMCHGALDTQAFGVRHGLVFADYFTDALQRLDALAADGLVTRDAHTIQVTARGRLLLRVIAMCFDAYLHDQQPAARYSRAI